MTTNDPSFSWSIASLVSTFEMTLSTGVAESRQLRAELWLHADGRYSGRVFEYLNCVVMLHQDEPPVEADETVLVERSWYWLSSLFNKTFTSDTVSSATDLLIQDIQRASRGEH